MLVCAQPRSHPTQCPHAYSHPHLPPQAAALHSPSGAGAPADKDLAICKNCHRFNPAPYQHSFSASLDQTKNQSWHASNSGWIVTPTSSEIGTAAVSNAAFCSGECLYSFLFSQELLSNKTPDAALHFFKRVDAQRNWSRTTPSEPPGRRSEEEAVAAAPLGGRASARARDM